MNLIVDNTTGKQAGNYKPEPAQPRPLDNDELRRIREGGYRSTGVFLPNGQPQLEPLPAAPQPTERVTEGPNGTTRTYTQPRGSAPAAAPKPEVSAKLGTSGQTPSGVKYELQGAPQASTQTGQMPNEAYAAPLSPEQMLAEARNEYARTGSDAALKQYFAQYPSEAVRFNQQEQKIWQQIGEQSAAYGRAVDRRAGAQTARERAINDPNRNAYGAMGAGSEALLWEAQNPQAMALSAPLPPLDMSLFERARRLNAQAQAARQGMPVPAGWADDPGRVPALPPLPLPTPPRPFWQTVGMGASAMSNDLSRLPGRVAAYGRNNPLLTIRR